MGMFTSAYDDLGNEYQFKTGDDQCDNYHIGKPPMYGYRVIPDDIYDGLNSTVYGHSFIVIKNNVVVEIQDEEMIHRTRVARQAQLDALCVKWELSKRECNGFDKDLSGEPPEPEKTPEELAAEKAYWDSPEGQARKKVWSDKLDEITNSTVRSRKLLRMIDKNG